MVAFRATLFLIALALCAGCGSAQGPLTAGAARLLPAGLHGPSASQKLSHVIVIVQENRSLENFFAGYPGANAPTTGCALPGSRAARRSVVPASMRVYRRASGSGCPPGDISVPLVQTTFKQNPDLRHDWLASMTDWNNGNMDGFSKWGGPGDPAYVYMEQSEIQPYWSMAQQYVLADEMFPTEFGGSFTGHLTLVAGTDDIKLPGRAEVDFPNHSPDDCDSPPGTKSSYITNKPYRKRYGFLGPFPCFNQFSSIAQVLDGAGVSWKIYATRVLKAGFWEPFEALSYVRCATFTPPHNCSGFGADWYTDIIAPETQVLHDATYGNLASVTWVTPSKLDSDHPARHSDTGPSWVTSVVNAVGESAYWSSSAIIVVWDDWGGFYDNAPPPQLDYRGLGIRVPCLIISPYAKQGYVSHVQYEYGSILRFIEEVYGLPAGAIGPTSSGYTDGRANSLDDAFDFTQNPRPFYPIGSKYPMSHFTHEPRSDEPVDTE
jgi:phospholipase C